MILSRIILLIALAGGIVHLLQSWLGIFSPMEMRPVHLAFVFALAFLTDIQSNPSPLRRAANLVMVIFGVLGSGYIFLNFEGLAYRAGIIDPENVFFGIVLILLIIITTLRFFGWPLTLVLLVFLAYALFGDVLPRPLYHRGFDIAEVSNFLYTTANGIFGVPIAVSARYLVLFLILAEFLVRSRTDKLFIAVAQQVAKVARGGAAKAAVVGSALFGTISGTPIANVMVTGSFTIPMMKRAGFPAKMAAAVEATASTGGLIMPPIMGSAAFLMAEMVGVSYANIIWAAVIPAILYFLSLYLAVDMEAAQNPRIQNVKDLEAIRIRDYLHTIIPLVFFLVVILMGYSVFRGALVAIALTPLIAAFKAETRMSFRDILEAIADGMQKTVRLGITTAAAGIIVGVISLTGLGFSFEVLLRMFQDLPIGALLITALLCLVIGMGMPAVAAYVIVATLAVPALSSMGFETFAAHFFVMFFTAFASITPPVALATYSAAALAESDPWESGFEGFKLASVAFLVPFMFIYSPVLLAQTGWMDILWALPTAVLGVILYVGGIQGYLYFAGSLHWPARILILLGGLFFIETHLVTDIIGLVLGVLGVAIARWFPGSAARKP